MSRRFYFRRVECPLCLKGDIQAKTDDEDMRADEREHLPVRAYPNIVAAIQHGDGRNEGQVVINFVFSRATDVIDAVRQIASDPQAKFIAGGTNRIDLMKYDLDCTSAVQDREGNNIIIG